MTGGGERIRSGTITVHFCWCLVVRYLESNRVQSTGSPSLKGLLGSCLPNIINLTVTGRARFWVYFVFDTRLDQGWSLNLLVDAHI